MPITFGINDVIDGKIDARTAVEMLMTRDKKNELD
jgi:glycerol-3-phosphate dehydrogenase